MLQEGTWNMSWNWMDGCKPTKHAGIYKTKTGYRVRVRAVDPRTDTLKGVNREYEGITLEDAVVKQAELRAELRSAGRRDEVARVKYVDYVTSLLRKKIAVGDLNSAKTREQWAHVQDVHLIPAFGDWYVDAIKRADVEDWRTEQGERVQRKRYSPNTANGWIRVLLTTLRHAMVDLDLQHDPTRGVKPLDTSTRHTYTEEEPNALTVEEMPRFMAKAWDLYPQHFAMLALGFGTGRRPSELRPLRRMGPTPDILWNEGVLLIRRSETKGEVMERTKTGRRLRVPLPEVLMQILRRHVRELPPGPARDSELLFPSTTGGYRSSTTLDKPIKAIAKAAKVGKRLSARCMRRTFQDLGRAAEVHDFVARAISGHATVEMQSHYSSVSGEEVRQGLAKVISLAGIREQVRVGAEGEKGSGDKGSSGHAGGHAGTEAVSKAAG